MRKTGLLTVRDMRWDDIPRLLQIAEQSASPWIRPDFREVFQRSETLGFVAEESGRIVGFGQCTIERTAARTGRSRIAWWRRWKWPFSGGESIVARRINLFALATVAAAAGVELALLQYFQRRIGTAADQLEAIVPEIDLIAQDLLREAGFVAIRAVAGYYCHIDGYLMIRDNRRDPAAEDCQVEPSPITMRRRGVRPR